MLTGKEMLGILKANKELAAEKKSLDAEKAAKKSAKKQN